MTVGWISLNSSQGGIQLFLGNGNGTFGAPEVVETLGPGMTLYGIVSGNFYGNDNLDLAVLVTLPGDDLEIQVLSGHGDGTFGQPTITELGPFSSNSTIDLSKPSLVAGEFADNNLTDLVVSDGTSLEVLLGEGDGMFSTPSPVQLPASNPPSEIPTIKDLMVGDFDGEEHPSLAFLEATSSQDLLDDDYCIVVLPGNGNGTFGAPIITALTQGGNSTSLIGGGIVDIVAGDIGEDGKFDLAIAFSDLGDGSLFNERTWVEILPGEGNGTFGAPTTVYSQSYSLFAETFINQILVGDFNGDGHLDLLLDDDPVFGNGAMILLPGLGNGSFVSPSPLLEVGTDLPIAAGDFNGDGEVALAYQDGDSVIALDYGLGDGSNLQDTALLADATGDGTDDLLIVDQSGEILWRQGQSYDPGSFDPPVAINPEGPASVAIAIIQTSRGPIVASADRDDNFVTLFADRGGRFVAIGSLATGQAPSQILAADLENNGDEDLVVLNAGDDSVAIFLGDGDGGFTKEGSDIPIGLGASSIALADLDATGRPDLIVTNSLTGTVGVRRNLGNGSFADPSPYTAGAGPYSMNLDADGVPASLDATAAVASGVFTPQGPLGLVTLDPGTNSLAVLEGLVNGAIGNPITTLTTGQAQVVSTGEFSDDGLTDLAVLGSDGLSVYMANGRGGFDPPTVYDVGTDPTGLTVADVNHDGNLDLLVGNAEGDVLILLGDGKGEFAPSRESQQAITLAVADLGGSPDLILADQGLDRVVVDYGSGRSAVLGDQASGVLAPGAVTLADLNGDGIPDLIVANSGGNDILVYPGLGDGQFGPAMEGPDGIGFPVGTDPVSVTVADLNGRPDLIVADAGSNDVAILLNVPVVNDFDGPYLPGDTFTFATGPRLDAGLGPVSTAVQQIKGDPYPDLLVSDSGSNEVTVLQGRGGGYFSDQNPEVIPVGNDPGQLLLGDFGGRPGEVNLVTIDSGSNDLSLIADINGGDLIAQSIPSGGLDPVAGLEGEFDGSLGLLVANNADGHLVLFLGGPDGLDLSRTFDVNGLPHPTALVMDASGNIFGGSEGVEAAIPVILGYSASGSGTQAPIAAQEPADQQVALVQPLGESAFAMVTTLLSMPGETTGVEAAATAAGLPNQPRSVAMSPDDLGEDEPIAETTEAVPSLPPTQAIPPALVRLVAGLDEELAAIGLTVRRGRLFEAVTSPRTIMRILEALDQVLVRWTPMVGLVGPPSWPATGPVVRAAAPGILQVLGDSQHIPSPHANPDNTILSAPDDRETGVKSAVPDRSDSSEDADPSDTADVPIGASAVGLAVWMSSLAHLYGPRGPRWRSPTTRPPRHDRRTVRGPGSSGGGSAGPSAGS